MGLQVAVRRLTEEMYIFIGQKNNFSPSFGELTHSWDESRTLSTECSLGTPNLVNAFLCYHNVIMVQHQGNWPHCVLGEPCGPRRSDCSPCIRGCGFVDGAQMRPAWWIPGGTSCTGRATPFPACRWVDTMSLKALLHASSSSSMVFC